MFLKFYNCQSDSNWLQTAVILSPDGWLFVVKSFIQYRSTYNYHIRLIKEQTNKFIAIWSFTFNTYIGICILLTCKNLLLLFLFLYLIIDFSSFRRWNLLLGRICRRTHHINQEDYKMDYLRKIIKYIYLFI